MPFTVTMPKLSPTMETGTIVKWYKNVGDFVHSGEALLDVATDKATVEYNALDEGWLRQILIQGGQEAHVNQPIAICTAEEKESIEGYQPQGITASEKEVKQTEELNTSESSEKTQEAASKKSLNKKEEIVFTQPQFFPEPPIENYCFDHPTEHLDQRILASPLAKKLAKEKGLDLSTINGSGPNQRIMSRDLVKAQPSGIAAFGHRHAPSLPPGSYEERPLSPIRKVIGQRLQASKSFIPHFYVTQIIDAKPLVVIREQLKNQGIKVSVNDFIVKAAALTLKEHPAVNTGFNSVNQTIIQFKTIDISIAVNINDGLITPIVRHADRKNLGEIALEIRSLAQKARDGNLDPQEYKGGSFTISNLGMYGVSEFQAILNPPQAAILAIAGIQDVPVICNNAVVPGKVLNVTLSVDHRVVDGVAAAQFLQTLKKILENPAILLIN